MSAVSLEHADDRIYLTGRANLQLRGMSGDGDNSTETALAAIESTGLLPSRTHELVGNALVSPQTGLAGGRADLREIATELDAALCGDAELGSLPGRFLFTLDDGRGDVDRLTGTGKRGTDLGFVALGDGEVQLRVGDHWEEVTVMTDAVTWLSTWRDNSSTVAGRPWDAAWHVRELRPAAAAPGARRSPNPQSGCAACLRRCSRGSHLPADDGVLTHGQVESLLERASDVEHLVVTPARHPDSRRPESIPMTARRPARRYDYIADGPAIYADSFATIRREKPTCRTSPPKPKSSLCEWFTAPASPTSAIW